MVIIVWVLTEHYKWFLKPFRNWKLAVVHIAKPKQTVEVCPIFVKGLNKSVLFYMSEFYLMFLVSMANWVTLSAGKYLFNVTTKLTLKL